MSISSMSTTTEPATTEPATTDPATTTDRTAVDPTPDPPGAPTSPGRLAVPWWTVLSLGVVLAYGDGFWMVSLRGAVGAIERTRGPFASWLLESTLLLPIFVFTVLAALTLAMRWFGPDLRKPRAVAATGLLVVAAGTIAGLAAIVASSAYDYHLQSSQPMSNMASMGSMAHDQQKTLALHVHAVTYISGWLLLTNIVLVAWVVAMRGGRLRVSITKPQHQDPTSAPVGGLMASAHVRALMAVALVAVTAIGIAGIRMS